MSEIEQIIASSIEALKLNPHMDAYDKAMLCEKLADIAHQGFRHFLDEFERGEAEKDAA